MNKLSAISDASVHIAFYVKIYRINISFCRLNHSNKYFSFLYEWVDKSIELLE